MSIEETENNEELMDSLIDSSSYQYLDEALEAQKKQETTETNHLRAKVKNFVENTTGATGSQIDKGDVKNPFPIGRRQVYQFLCGKDITPSHKWKLHVFFKSKER